MTIAAGGEGKGRRRGDGEIKRWEGGEGMRRGDE